MKSRILTALHVYRDIIAGLVLFIIFALYFYSASQIKSLMSNTLTSGFVPEVIAVLMMIISVLLIIGGIRDIPKRRATLTEMNSVYGAEVDKKAVAVLMTFGIFAFALVLMQYLGFIIGGIVYLFLQNLILVPKSERKILRTAVVSVIATVVIFFVFRYAFSINLPMGIFK